MIFHIISFLVNQKNGITNLGHISTDGTKMKAKASNNYTLSKEEIEGIRIIKMMRSKRWVIAYIQ